MKRIYLDEVKATKRRKAKKGTEEEVIPIRQDAIQSYVPQIVQPVQMSDEAYKQMLHQQILINQGVIRNPDDIRSKLNTNYAVPGDSEETKYALSLQQQLNAQGQQLFNQQTAKNLEALFGASSPSGIYNLLNLDNQIHGNKALALDLAAIPLSIGAGFVKQGIKRSIRYLTNPYRNLNFYRMLDGLPTIENGRVLLSPKNNSFTNLTTDLPFRLHKSYSHLPGGEVMVINGRALRGHTPLSIEPMDTFFRNNIRLRPEDITIITGSKDLYERGTKLGFKMKTSRILQDLYPTQEIPSYINPFDKFQISKRGAGYSISAKQYKAAIDDYITQTFGRPTLKDYRKLERITGLNAGVEPYLGQDKVLLQLHDEYSQLPLSQLNNDNVLFTFPNGRTKTSRNIVFNSLRDNLNYRNVFYDPTTRIEHNFTKSLGFSSKPKRNPILDASLESYINLKGIRPMKYGGKIRTKGKYGIDKEQKK